MLPSPLIGFRFPYTRRRLRFTLAQQRHHSMVPRLRLLKSIAWQPICANQTKESIRIVFHLQYSGQCVGSLNLHIVRTPFVTFTRIGGRRWQISNEIVNAQQFLVLGKCRLQNFLPEWTVHSAKNRNELVTDIFAILHLIAAGLTSHRDF